ncbi:histone H2A, orphon-like [Porphyrio hochstetteri]
MSGEEEVCEVLEQDQEPEATGPGQFYEVSEAKAKKSRTSRSSRAGLLFSISRVDRMLRRGHFAERIGAKAPVFLAAVLQWVTRETVDVAGKIAKKSKQHCISPSHLQGAMQKCSVLRHLLRGDVLGCVSSAGPQRPRVASPSKKKMTKSKKRCPTQRRALARSAAAI